MNKRLISLGFLSIIPLLLNIFVFPKMINTDGATLKIVMGKVQILEENLYNSLKTNIQKKNLTNLHLVGVRINFENYFNYSKLHARVFLTLRTKQNVPDYKRIIDDLSKYANKKIQNSNLSVGFYWT